VGEYVRSSLPSSQHQLQTPLDQLRRINPPLRHDYTTEQTFPCSLILPCVSAAIYSVTVTHSISDHSSLL